MVKDDTYRITIHNYNRLMYRPEDKEVTLSRLTTYVNREGELLNEQKARQADEILSAYDCFDSHGKFKEGAELPEQLKPMDIDWINIDAVKAVANLDQSVLDKLSSLSVDDAIKMDIDELQSLIGGESKPYSDNIVYLRKRRDGRVEVDPEAKEKRLQNYAAWLNSNNDVPWQKKLLKQWKVEKDSSQTTRISIDAVLVEEQVEHHVSGGKPEMKKSKSYIKHWDIRVDDDQKSYFITSVDEEAAYKQLLALLIKTKLINRYLVFFIDGETKIHTAINAYFKPWSHAVYLDFHHLQEKIELLASSMIVSRRVPNPSAKPEYYTRGEKAGQLKEPEKTALSNLYNKEMASMAWSGNLVPLVAYIRLIPETDIKSEEARNSLLTYIKNKQDWITCYRIRKIVGLPNSSNVVEQENQMIVSIRQKDELMAWRTIGSSSVASISAMYRNNEQDTWYEEGTLNMELWQMLKVG